MEHAPAAGLIRYVPNALTVLRLCALPVIVYLYSLDAPGSSWTTAIVILVAALSDVADGYIARHYHVQSEFGRWVDPIVDRAFFFTIVAMLWYFGTLPWLAVVPLLIRDGIILILAIPTRVYTTKGPEITPLGQGVQLHPDLRAAVVHRRHPGARLGVLRRRRHALHRQRPLVRLQGGRLGAARARGGRAGLTVRRRYPSGTLAVQSPDSRGGACAQWSWPAARARVFVRSRATSPSRWCRCAASRAWSTSSSCSRGTASTRPWSPSCSCPRSSATTSATAPRWA